MGIIKDGSISGVLPSSTSEAFAIHYPGYPTSTERAVQSLGGPEAILKVRLSKNLDPDKSKKLELNFRPEDPFSHTVLGKCTSCNNFLLRISKKKKNVQSIEELGKLDRVAEALADSNLPEQYTSSSELPGTSQQTVPTQHESVLASSDVDGQIQSGVEEQLYADIVSRVSEAYHFNGMSDYQIDYQEMKRKGIDAEPELEKGGLLDLVEDVDCRIPPRYSAKDQPKLVIFKKSVDVSLRKKRRVDVQQSSELEIEQCLAIDFNIKEIPKKVNWEKSIPSDSEIWQWQKAVCQLFEEHPIWAKSSLVERLVDQGLKVVTEKLKRFLVVAAYYFSNGPFLRFWIRKGYDPRKDPESRIYQRIDFRVPPSLRSYCDTNVASGLKHRWDDICAFQVFPYKCQTSLQLFELKDEYIQQEIRKPAKQGNCSLQAGWFSPHVIDTLRFRVSMRFLSVYPEGGAESLLKSVSNRFEKAKRTPTDSKNAKVHGKEKQANKGIQRKEDKEHNDEVGCDEEGGEATEEVDVGEEDEEDYDDDDDEMEDAIREDLDAEAPDLAGQTDSFLQELDLHHDSISKEYLQGLFNSFSDNPADGGMPDEADPDDGEFQIYGQDSDDNYSDDEIY